MTARGQPQRLVLKFVVGMIWLFLPAIALAAISGQPVALVLVILSLAWLVCSGLLLWWMTLWASRRESRLGQFGVGSLLFAAVFVALFLGFVRWIVMAPLPAGTVLTNPGELFCVVALVVLFWLVVSLRILAGLTEAVLWGAVWVLNRPGVRRWRRRKPEDREPAGDP